MRARPDTLQIEVRDSGSRIPDTERIFDPYWRGAAASRVPGAGLGLYLSRRIARAQGGDLRAELLPDGGSRFLPSLPLSVPR